MEWRDRVISLLSSRTGSLHFPSGILGGLGTSTLHVYGTPKNSIVVWGGWTMAQYASMHKGNHKKYCAWQKWCADWEWGSEQGQAKKRDLLLTDRSGVHGQMDKSAFWVHFRSNKYLHLFPYPVPASYPWASGVWLFCASLIFFFGFWLLAFALFPDTCAKEEEKTLSVGFLFCFFFLTFLVFG